MLIEIKKDVIEEALKKKGQKQNEPLDLLFQMAICAKRGRHVVWVPSLVEDGELRTALSELITEANVNALCFAEERHPHDVGRLNREMKIKTIISYKNQKKSTKEIFVNPHQEPSFEPYTELYLLVENLIDAEFYQIVLNLYREEKGLTPYECAMYPLMGGGVTTAKVMASEVYLRQHYCLAVSDSDKTRPQCGLGQTPHDIKRALSGTHFNCDVYYLEYVREIENLIPRKVVRYLYPLQAGQIDIFTKDPSFFDMKLGLCLMNLLEDKDCNYWRGLLPEKQADFNQRDTIKGANPSKQSFENSLKAVNHVLVEGFGTNLLKRVLDADDDAIPVVRQENINAKSMLHQTQVSDLNTFQEKEWEQIGETLFCWSCGMKAI